MTFLAGWTRQKPITIPAAYVGGSLVDFPLLVRITNDAEIGAAARADGYDIRFTLADGTLLSYERVAFSITNGLANGLFWVKVPSLTSGVAGSILCQYANAAATDVSGTAAWDSNHCAVYHLGETGTNPTVHDATANAKNSTAQTWTPSISGQVGGCASLNNSAITVPDQTFSGEFSISVWTNPASLADSRILYRYVDGSGFFLGPQADTAWRWLVFTGGTSAAIVSNTLASLSTWVHLAAVRRADNTLVLYRNGVAQTNTAVKSGSIAGSATVCMGSDYGTTKRYNGLLDEVRIAGSSRSAAWWSLEYNCVANQSSAVLWGDEVRAFRPAWAIRRRQMIGGGVI